MSAEGLLISVGQTYIAFLCDGGAGGGGLGEAGGGGVSVREEVCATPRCTEPPESSSPESSLCVACWALRVAASRPGVQKLLVVGTVKAASKDAHRAARVDLVVDASAASAGRR